MNKIKFINSAYQNFPIETNANYNIPHKVNQYIYSQVVPTPLKNPKLIHFSEDVCNLLNIEKDNFQIQEFIDCLTGNQIFQTSKPIAHNYCGFQFGNFAGQLGDGRAISLGDMLNEKNQLYEIQLKGAGKTPYSRHADGRAVLRSSIREYLASEALHYLNIPTTRALSLILSDDKVHRDLLYNGNVILEKCAVVSRVAPSFIRFGSFEVTLPQTNSFPGGSCKDHGEQFTQKLIDYLLKYHYSDKKDIFEIYKEIVQRSAKLVSDWQSVGFVHGVLNTDNMSILGLTIDYGPYGFMEYFDQDFIPNHSDKEGRYSYKNQPQIFQWNLIKLAESLTYTNLTKQMIQYTNQEFKIIYEHNHNNKFANKLGFQAYNKDIVQLIDLLYQTMQQTGSDFTNLFLILSQITEENKEFQIENIVNICAPIDYFISQKPQISKEQLYQLQQLYQKSPQQLLMYGIDGQFLEAQQSLFDKIEKQKNKSQQSKIQENYELWTKFIDEYLLLRNKYGFDQKLMQQNNPQIILRNHILQSVIEKAENDEFNDLQQLFEQIKRPFDLKQDKFKQVKPKWAYDLCVSCSS